MERKEKVLAYIQSREYIPLKLDEMATVLDVPEEDKGELEAILNTLCADGDIYTTKKERYIAVDDKNCTVSGKLNCNAKGYFGFIICEGEDVYIAGDDMADALHGDKVLARLKNTRKGGRREGYIIRVLERGNETVVGTIYKIKNGYYCMRPDNRRIYTKISIEPEKLMNAEIGDRVSVNIIKYSDSGKVFGEVTSVLGEEHDLKSCVEGIILENHIKQFFDNETLAEADSISDTVSWTGDREDLRNKLIFTIDGDDARDFDDAVSLDITEDGNYMLGVHIADVSEYVTEKSALDREAYERGTSVYLPDRVIPMLPEKLSNGICSLNPNTDRLTLSVFMEIDGEGTVINHRLTKAVICSKERMTYNNVNTMLESDSEMCERYSHLLPTIKSMEKLASILHNKRVKRGAINFDFPESRIVVNEDGEPIDIQREIRGISNKIIEEFMLAANETVAEYAFWAEIPFIYRNHEAPSEDKIAAFNAFLLNFGLSIKGKIDRDNPVKPKALQQILDKAENTPEERIISRNMLQSLMKAKYSDECLGHFGLAAKYYCHFTSPIRRYPDLEIHRILKAFIDGRLDENMMHNLKGYVSAASVRSSECEVNAEYAERDCDDLMKAAYMSSLVGESFEGVISGITNFGMFVELDNSVEGLIRLENMTDDYYEFDENSSSLIGKRKKRVYTIGNNVKVVLAHTDILLRQIDFVLERDFSERVLSKFNREKPKVKDTLIKKSKKRYTKKKYYKRKHKRNG